MIKNLSIGSRLLTGFFILILTFSSLIFLGIEKMNSLSDLTGMMYNHPLTVSNAVLRVNSNIIKIHRTMKDVVLERDYMKIEEISTIVDALEGEVYKDFEIIAERFLGESIMYEETLKLFNDWKPIRDKVILLMQEARQDEAAGITKGEGAQHVEKLEESTNRMNAFAHNKSLEFLQNADSIKSDSIKMMFILFAVTASTALIFVYTLTQSIIKPLSVLKNSIVKIGTGDLETAINITSGGEIAELGRDFDDMRLKLKESYSDLENKVIQKTKELANTLDDIQDHNLQLINTQNAMLNLVEDLEDSKENLEQRIDERTNELRKTHEQLLHVEKLSAIGGLSASIAHEFNNPLQGVMTVIKGIKKRVPLEEEDAQLVDMAILECDRMRDLIKSLQDFNKPTSGRVAPMDIHAAIHSLLLLNRNEFDKKKITVETSFGEKIPKIQAVSDQIKQVLLNLIKNAIYACEDGETITIQTVAKNKNIIIRIIDTGTGIASEFIGHIFEPFYTTKPDIKGTGLGLSVSYGIVKEHGGTIEVESEVGKGTTFSVILPIDQQPMISNRSPAIQ